MMQKRYSNIPGSWLLILMVLIFSGCESILFIELEEADKLIVVSGAITNDTVAIQISRTRHILDNAPVVPLENATVRLLQGGSLIDELTYIENGYFLAADFIPQIGERYTIEVENAGYPAVTATSAIPEPVPIEALDTTSRIIEYDDGWGTWTEEYLQFDLTINDPQGEDNYYLLTAETDRSRTEYMGDITVTVLDSFYYGGQWNYQLRDSTYAVYEIQRYTDYPYISSEDIVVEALTSHGILFSDQLIDGKTYSFRGQFDYHQLRSADSAVVDLRLQSISESYYKYLKSREKHYNTKDNYLAVPVIVYSNVTDGAGFFGGFSQDEQTFTTFIPEYGREYWYPEY
ncbi:MAG: DUF4249 domain-containing protein [Bacteroidota bacterium]